MLFAYKLFYLQFFRGLESADNSICRALIELRINHNIENANEHEEFVANLTRKVCI